MYSRLPHWVLGFHGCDQSTYEDVLFHKGTLEPSTNQWDWLGNGIYFWEHSYDRALEWAQGLKERKKIKEPAVIGAVIDLGRCLNLTDYASSKVLKEGYKLLEAYCASSGVPLPENRPLKRSRDILVRNLDCAVVQQIHAFHNEQGTSYDSVRGIFTEGEPAYPGAAFLEKTHVQICVVNPNCIKGYFAPRVSVNQYRLP